MAKMTKAQAKRRLLEASNKFAQVYMNYRGARTSSAVVKTADMEAIDKIVSRCLSRIQ